MLVAFALHIVLNSVLKEFPGENLSGAELQDYLAREAGNWAVVHGFRYVAFAGIVLFAAGLFVRTCGNRSVASSGWGIVGLLGAALWVTNGVITNGIEIVAFMDFTHLSEQDDLFWLLFQMTRVLFTAEVATWAITIFGFCVAGWRSGTLPRSLVVPGLLGSTVGLLSNVFIVSVLSGGWGAILLEMAATLSLLWFVSTGIYMLVTGRG